MEVVLFRVDEDSILRSIGTVSEVSSDFTAKLINFLWAIGDKAKGIGYIFEENGKKWCMLINHRQGVNVVEYVSEPYNCWEVNFHDVDGDMLGRMIWGHGLSSFREYAVTTFAELVALAEAGRSITDMRSQPHYSLEKAHALRP